MKINLDHLGIVTSIACAIHCTLLPLIISALPLLGIDLLENKSIEWSMIGLALLFGGVSLYHGYRHHHGKLLPILLFAIGFGCLILNQVFAETFVYWFIPISATAILSAHFSNMYLSRKCKS